MKIQLADINPSYELNIKGTEAWLAPLYEAFKAGESPEKVVTGSLNFELELAGTVKVAGNLSFSPLIECGRCDKLVNWPLTANIKTRYYEPSFEGEKSKDRDLTASELDAYYIEGSQVDALALIIDSLNEQIPNHPVLLTEDGNHCQVCLDPVGSQNYEDPANADTSPFAALKNLKTRN